VIIMVGSPAYCSRKAYLVRRRLTALLAVLATALVVMSATSASASVTREHGGGGFITRHGDELTLDGHQFAIVGSNNYYPEYSSRVMVDDLFDRARAARFTVMRIWGFLDVGALNGPKNGISFQSFDTTAGHPVYNDGATGLQLLDYAIAKAGADGLRLVIPFTNNWRDFGGIDQYVSWAGLSHHDDFYTSATIRQWYKDWISHLLNRVNTVTGVAYKDDPTVMTWELANEPRCENGPSGFPASANCGTATMIAWADEMSRFVKSVDRHHLTSVGDEGFFCDAPAPGNPDFTTNCVEGVDTVAFAKLPAIDVMSFHLYPDGWGKRPQEQFGLDWIARHFAAARKIHKAAMLGEFGLVDKATRNVVYRHWTDAVIRAHGNGFLYWILSGKQDDGSLYPDFDGFTVYCPGPVCQTITNAGLMLRGGPPLFNPVADNDTAVTESGVAVMLTPAANDTAYLTTVDAATIDLDPATAGAQKTTTSAAGVFSVNADNTVTFTPADGFFGTGSATYTVRDRFHRLSNVANLTVTVKPSQTGAVRLFSFEDGTQGWGNLHNDPALGTVSSEPDFATDGTLGLHVSANNEWFGTFFADPVDFSHHSELTWDLRNSPGGTSWSLALQAGDDFNFCQGPFTFVPGGQTVHIEAVLSDVSTCFGAEPTPDLTKVRAIWIFFNPGEYDVDNVQLI